MSTSPAPLLSREMPALEVTRVSSLLVRDYLEAAPALAPFFSGHPDDPAAYRAKAAEVEARLDAAARQRLRGAFRPVSERAAHKLEQVLAGEGFFVTTGQQTGLFTGPLYTIHKALSAIRLASELERLLVRPVLALFWSAADDHDWDEVAHAAVVGNTGYVERIALGAEPDAAPVAMSHRLLGAGVDVAIDELRAALPDTDYRDRLMPRLRAAYRQGRPMAAAFEDTLATVLEGQEIALVSAAHPLVKQHAAGVIARALREAETQEAAVARQTERLAAAGYPPQVSIAAGASNVFLQTEQARDRLVREGERWTLRRTRRQLSEEELLRWLEHDPAAFSPNVLLRPVVESALFPTLAYVGGPAEVSYFAQIGCLFASHGIMPPVAVPRHSVTIIEPQVERSLARFGLAPADVRRPFESLVGELLAREMPESVRVALGRLRQDLGAGFEALARTTDAVDERLRGAVAGARNQALAQVRQLERRIGRQYRQLHEVRFEQLRRAAANLYPDDSPQERVLNVLPYLVRYGPGLLDEVRERMQVRLERRVPEYGVKCDD